ncbi:MAG: hypothetical protein NTY77_05615 [Elusimicrobia bacterium]|nr:hypothetical protein [Elusimicrobiota bacterium]
MAEVQVLNAGRREYRTSKGRLLPGKIHLLSGAEAAKMLSYKDLKDVAKMGPAAKGLKEIAAENEQLKKQVKSLQDQLAGKAPDPEHAPAGPAKSPKAPAGPAKSPKAPAGPAKKDK